MRFGGAIVICALVAIASTAGCSSDDGAKEGPPFEPANIDSRESLLITNSDIAAAGSSTPYAVVLRWWQSFQRGKVGAVKRSYAGEGASRKKAKRQIDRFRHHFSAPMKPEVRTDGGRATVNVTVRTARRADEAPRVISINEFAANFPLLRESGEWRIRPAAYRRYIERRKITHPPPPGG